jgi:hypothetical protein
MRTIKTTMGALGLALLLSSAGACDKDEKEKTDADKPKAGQKDADKRVKDEDKTTTEAPSRPPASKHVVVNEYVVCTETCAGKSADDRPTCHKNCAASVTAGTGDPASTACPRGCTESFGSCLMTCDDKSAANAATCRIQCQQLADKCIDGCV